MLLRFHCPECGFGDHELGSVDDLDGIHCIVCAEETGRLIRVRRWREDDAAIEVVAVLEAA